MAILIATVPSGGTPQAATPTFSPAAGTYATARTVTISTTTVGAAIYYTINGGIPSPTSTLYTGPLNISSNSNIQAIAVLSGYINSAVGSAAYSIGNAAAAPTFIPSAGVYSVAQSVTMASATTGASIYYTTDGTTPTYPITGTTLLYTGAVTVSTSETVKAIAVATGYLNSSVSSASYTISAGSGNYLGMNLAGVAYYTSEIPFLNLMKQGGGNQGVINTGWYVNGVSNGSGDLNTDSNGYPKSLTGVSGTVYSNASLLVLTNIATGTPTQTYPLPPGPYTFQFTGKGKIAITGTTGSITSISNTGTGTSTYSGTTIDSTNTTGITTAIFTVPNPSSIGFEITTTSIPDDTDWPRAMSLVETDLWSTARENGGTQIFHPLFKNYLIELGVDRLRFMDWGSTNNLNPNINFTGSLAAMATSATLTSVWNNPTGTYTVLLSTGQQIASTFTFNSTSVAFGTPVSAAASSGAWYVVNQYWSNRSNWGDCGYCTQKAVPVEVMLQLCNELNVDAWICVPLGADSSYWTGMANLAYNGAGSTIPGFTGLNPGLKCYVELSNELWNYATSVEGASTAYAQANFASGGFLAQSNWYGSQVATIADAWYAIYGSQFASRVCVSMGGQYTPGNGSYYMLQSMNTPLWTSAAYTHHIGAIHYAPYFSSPFNPGTATLFASPPTGTSGSMQEVRDSSVSSTGYAPLPAGNYLITFSDNEVRYITVSSSTLTFTADPTGNSGTLTSPLAPGSYLFRFSTSGGTADRLVTQTSSSTSVTWSGNSVTANSANATVTSSIVSWASAGSPSGPLTGSPTTSAQVGDVPAILAASSPIDAFFGTAYSTTYNGVTYPSVPAGGWVGCVSSILSSLFTESYGLAGQVWATGGAQAVPILGYESGSGLVAGTGGSAYLSLITAAHRDVRLGLCYYDPNNTLYNTYGYPGSNGRTGYLNDMITAGFQSINQFNDVGGIGTYGEWGAIESIMQTLSPISSAPYKAQAIANWIAS